MRNFGALLPEYVSDEWNKVSSQRFARPVKKPASRAGRIFFALHARCAARSRLERDRKFTTNPRE